MNADVDKGLLLAELRAELTRELDAYVRRARDAAEAATHEENRPEGDKDMRSTEASYVARGQVGRVRELEGALARLTAMAVRKFSAGDAIQASALVVLTHDEGSTAYWLVTAGGGVRLKNAGTEVLTLATTSPLGASLLGLEEGDDVTVTTPRGPRTYSIASVR